MTYRARFCGFTLIELITSVAIFSTMLGVLFSVLGSLQRSKKFRDANVVVTQAANFAFEPMVRAIKTADGTESVKLQNSNTCLTYRGFYAVDDNDNPIGDPDDKIRKGEVIENLQAFAVIDTEPFQDTDNGTFYRWVKRVYRKAKPSNRNNDTIIERTYKAIEPAYAWPKPLECSTSNSIQVHWDSPPVERSLTGDRVAVTDFKVSRMISPVLGGNGVLSSAPFISIELSVADPQTDPKKRLATPITLRSTLTPTFSYGEQRD